MKTAQNASPTVLKTVPPLEAMPSAAGRHIRRLRSHPAGEFAGRLYREERWARRDGA